MMILHDAAGPAVLAVNVPSPSSLLSSWGAPGPFAIVFAETGRGGPGPWGPVRTPPGAPPLCIPKPARQDRLVDARPRMTVYIRARSGGQPKGARCLP
jgi:hypothetical protein